MELLKELKWHLLFLVIIAVFVGWLSWVSAVKEAEVFNKFTDGPKATWSDAFFAELRVEAK